MKIKLYKAKLDTVGKTSEQIRNSFDGAKPSEEEIQKWIKAYDAIDGIEVIVMKSWTGEGYSFVSWEDNYDEKIRDFIYQVEQDDLFGSYVNDREEFLKDWEQGEYSPAGSLVFNREDVVIIEELKKEPIQQ